MRQRLGAAGLAMLSIAAAILAFLAIDAARIAAPPVGDATSPIRDRLRHRPLGGSGRGRSSGIGGSQTAHGVRRDQAFRRRRRSSRRVAQRGSLLRRRPALALLERHAGLRPRW